MPRSEKELLEYLARVGKHPHEKEVNEILSCLATFMVRINDFSNILTQLSNEFHGAIHVSFGQAIPAIVQLGELLIHIPQTSGPDRHILVAKAKVSGNFISTTFQSIVDFGEVTIQSAELHKTHHAELQERVKQSSQKIAEWTQIAQGRVRSAIELKTMEEDAASKYRLEAQEARQSLDRGLEATR